MVLLGATVTAALLLMLWFWRRHRGRPVRDAAPATTAANAAAGSATATANPAAVAAAAVPAPTPRPAAPAEAVKTEAAPTDVNAAVTRLERTLRQRVPRRVAFRLSLLPELWQCRVDPEAVRALLLDLVDAAAADLKGNGDLVVGTRNFAFSEANLAATPGAQLGEYVRVTVRDNGPGLSDEALDRVFDAAATARPSAALAAETMRRLGGFARVESAEGVGTAVHLYFPRAATETKASPANSAAAAE
jgi:nitrogen-specific signal transduction histidine kinase